jgi:hypothetical protein
VAGVPRQYPVMPFSIVFDFQEISQFLKAQKTNVTQTPHYYPAKL